MSSSPPPQYSKTVPQVGFAPTTERKPSNGSLTLKSPRTPRFAEATAVHSPIDPSQTSNPFADPPTNHYAPQPQVSDVGFGYLGAQPKHESVEMEETDTRYLPPPTPRGGALKSPLKSAMKSPGAPPRNFGNLETVLSPTFREEQAVEREEKATEQEQAHDLKAKVRVRWAKLIMRGVNFSCSLIVLSMLSATFTIFNATKALPNRNGLPAWAPGTPIWPQITLLSIAAVSLIMCIVIFYGYWRGGHKRAEKVAVYYTTFAVGFFIFSIVMWGIGAAVLSSSKKNGGGNDMWGWSCKDNTRKQLFQDDVSYALVCRLQDWSLICCIIEVVVEVITIIIYGIVFYRYYSKRRLRKSMAQRDKARSDMYLAQLKQQSAPNTPGFGPSGILSPRDGGWRPPQGFEHYNKDRAMEEGEASDGTQYVTVAPRKIAEPKPFALQAPPIKIHAATPKQKQEGFEITKGADTINEHVPAAQGEAEYAPVAIPGSYTGPSLNSPGFAPQHQGGNFDFGLDSRLAKK